MDEIDAALDFKNVSIIANYIKVSRRQFLEKHCNRVSHCYFLFFLQERTRNAQFVIVSLRNNMFELANRMVGIYKTNNCTNSVTINPNAFRLGVQPAPNTKQLRREDKENDKENTTLN